MSDIRRVFQELSTDADPSGELVRVGTPHGQILVSFSNTVARLWIQSATRNATARGAAYRASSRAAVTVQRPMNIRLRAQTSEDDEHLASGVARELRTGDPEFDAQIYIETELDERAVRGVMNEGVRAAVLELVRISRGVAQLDHVILDDDQGHISAQWSYGRRDAGFDLAPAKAAVSTVDALADALPALIASGKPPPNPILARVVRTANWVSLGGVGAAGISFATIPKTAAPLLNECILAGVVLAACLIVACYFLIRGRADSPDLRARAMVASFWLPIEASVIVCKILSS